LCLRRWIFINLLFLFFHQQYRMWQNFPWKYLASSHNGRICYKIFIPHINLVINYNFFRSFSRSFLEYKYFYFLLTYSIDFFCSRFCQCVCVWVVFRSRWPWMPLSWSSYQRNIESVKKLTANVNVNIKKHTSTHEKM
jgi:hypothetical protein